MLKNMAHSLMRDVSPRDRLAAGLMAIAVLGYASAPLFVVWGEGQESPLMFAAAWKVGASVFTVIWLLWRHREIFFSKIVWNSTLRALTGSPLLAVAAVCQTWTFLYAWSTQFTDISIAATLYETWPIAHVWITRRLYRNESRYTPISPWSALLFALAFVGVGFVVFSQAGELTVFSAASTAAGNSLDFSKSIC